MKKIKEEKGNEIGSEEKKQERVMERRGIICTSLFLQVFHKNDKNNDRHSLKI